MSNLDEDIEGMNSSQNGIEDLQSVIKVRFFILKFQKLSKRFICSVYFYFACMHIVCIFLEKLL